jgi:hypothetical protein
VAGAQKFAAATGFLFILAAASVKARRSATTQVIDCPMRFDGLAIEEVPGELPVARLIGVFIHRCKG